MLHIESDDNWRMHLRRREHLIDQATSGERNSEDNIIKIQTMQLLVELGVTHGDAIMSRGTELGRLITSFGSPFNFDKALSSFLDLFGYLLLLCSADQTQLYLLIDGG